MTHVKQINVISIRELSQYLGLSDQTIEKYARLGRIPAFKVGPYWRFRVESIKKWMDEQESAAGNRGQLVSGDWGSLSGKA